jgi:hypothetical protein
MLTAEENLKELLPRLPAVTMVRQGASSLANTSNDVTQYKVYIRLLPESYTDLWVKAVSQSAPGMSATADIQTRTQTKCIKCAY